MGWLAMPGICFPVLFTGCIADRTDDIAIKRDNFQFGKKSSPGSGYDYLERLN
jgi:hypothetical protein